MLKEAEKVKFTPGEWRLADNHPFVYALNEHGTNRFEALIQPGWKYGLRIARMDERTSDAELRANARLIAASPELAAELAAMVALFMDRYPVKGLDGEAQQRIDAARAALSKAGA